MIIDCDSHIMPRDAFDHVGGSLTGDVPRLKFDECGCLVDVDFPANPAHRPGTTPLPVTDPSQGLTYRGLSDVGARLADHGRMGVDVQFVLPLLTGWWSYLLEPQVGAAIARSWNLSVLGLMGRYSRQILGVALIPLQDVQAAIRELEWATSQGFRAVLLDYVYPVAEHPYGTTLASHPESWAFLERVEQLDVPVFLHAVQHGHRIANLPTFQAHGLDFCAPNDAEMNLVSLITSGLLDDFPRLKIIHAETGTAHLKSLAKRMDARFEQRGNPVLHALHLAPPTALGERNRLPPSHYFRTNFFWTIETEEPGLAEAIDFLGAERFLFATDYPHDDAGGRMKFEDAQRLEEAAAISSPAKEAIRSGNARALFKLP
jgi:predicted TIM-barrel fold metal-dependent hydrolase